MLTFWMNWILFTGGCRITSQLIEKTITLNIDCSVVSARPESIFFDCSSILTPSCFHCNDWCAPQVPREQCSPVTKQVEREVCQVSSQFVYLIGKMSSPGIYSAAQEVPRSECQDVPSQVPKQVEKNVCKDIPRQVRLVNQSISPIADKGGNLVFYF